MQLKPTEPRINPSDETMLIFRLAICLVFFTKSAQNVSEKNTPHFEEVDATPEVLAQIEAQEQEAFKRNERLAHQERLNQIKERIFNKRLPEHLHGAAKPFQEIADTLVANCTPNRDAVLALEALEVAKDAAVRSLL